MHSSKGHAMTAHNHAEHAADCFRCDTTTEDKRAVEIRADTLRHAAQHIPNTYQHGDSPSAWLSRRADEMEAQA